MNHKNLMFGDWVRSAVTGKAYQVVEAGDPFIMVDNPGYVWLRTMGFKHRIVEPIPITADILEKNLFLKKRNGYYEKTVRNAMGYYYAAVSLEYNTIIIGEMFCHPEDVEECQWENEIYIKHKINVHELQHALRLCGLNDLADNLKVE